MQNTGTTPNIFLVGLMGAGKTTIGAAVAKRLKRPFFDSDHEIEARTGVSISVIFEHEQEIGFRQREARMIDELTQRSGIVLATGGGVVVQKQNREWLRQRGTVVYLHVPPDKLWPRLVHDKRRPLLQTDDLRTTLRALYDERDPLYRACAHFVFKAGDPLNEVVDRLLIQLGL